MADFPAGTGAVEFHHLRVHPRNEPTDQSIVERRLRGACALQRMHQATISDCDEIHPAGVAVRRARLNHRGETIPVVVDVVERAIERMRGLLGRACLDMSEALWLEPCNAIHTFGMRFPIDVVFIDASGRVLTIHPDVGRARMLVCWRARAALEMRAHAADAWRIAVGDSLAWEAVS